MTIDQKLGTTIDTPHQEKYRKLIHYLGRENVEAFIPFSIEELVQAFEKDPNLNSISIKKWDAACGYSNRIGADGKQQYLPSGYSLRQLFSKKEITYVSLSECVCTLKECARMMVEEVLQKEKITEDVELDK